MFEKNRRLTERAWPRSINLYIAIVAVALAFEIFLVSGNIGLNLADEGYFWYGVEGVFHGKVPIRDFEAYDPGRYYWSALWFHLWRPGIIPLRVSETLFKVLGLCLGLLVSKRLTQNRWELAGIGLVLAIWIYPDYKVFDCVVPMAAVYLGVKLLEHPKIFSFWVSGFFVSLCGFFGRNHGLYMFISFFFLLFFAGWGKEKKSTFIIAAIGLACGLIPFLVLCVGSPGFLSALIATIRIEIERGTTNIKLPIPWPWTVHFGSGMNSESVSSFIIGLLFAVIPFFYIYWCFLIFRNSGKFRELKVTKNVLLACVAVGVPYLQYAYSRADLVHLAVAVSPFWIGFFAQKSTSGWRRAFIGMGVALTLFSVADQSGLTRDLSYTRPSEDECQIGRDTLYLDPFTKKFIGNAKEMFRNIGPGRPLLIFPHLPTLYPVLGLESPIWGLYSVFPPADREQRDWIGEMEKNKVQWAFVDNWLIDGREDFGFLNSEPLFVQYFKKNFRIVNDPLVPPDCLLFHRIGPVEKNGSPETLDNPVQ